MVGVLQYITRRIFDNQSIGEMEEVIKLHHESYMNLFEANLTPKPHFMLHYPYYVRLFGPLRNSMVFRFEEKHHESKNYARVCYSRRFLSFSICKKFSFNFSYYVFEKKELEKFDSIIPLRNYLHQKGDY